MLPSPSPSTTRHATPTLFWWFLGITVVFALIPTVWTALDLKTAALFFPPAAHTDVEAWWWVELINLYIPAVFRGSVFLALAGWVWASVRASGKPWRLFFSFWVLAGALGPGLLVNSGFKEHWQRARPYQVENFGGTQQFTRAAVMADQCNNNCSFVSGHVACGFFLASVMLVQRKRRVAWAVAGAAAGSIIGFSRVAAGDHWLSDALWAAPITLVCSWVVWKLLLFAYPAPDLATPLDQTSSHGGVTQDQP